MEFRYDRHSATRRSLHRCEYLKDERSLLQVKIKEVDEADDIFTKLMGDVVEPRREFIQDNSLSANVDV
jgi:DNA gyrase/topoisomerase IV subunit B